MGQRSQEDAASHAITVVNPNGVLQSTTLYMLLLTCNHFADQLCQTADCSQRFSFVCSSILLRDTDCSSKHPLIEEAISC